MSANKLLGLYGQDIAVPALGFPDAGHHDLHESIVIIVSHSGGTFSSLACSIYFRNIDQARIGIHLSQVRQVMGQR